MADFQDYPEEPQTQPQTQRNWKTLFAFGWVRTPLGLLKIAELFVLLIALIIISTVDMVGSISSIEFFIFVNTSAWIFVLIVIILYILNVYHRLPTIVTSNIVMLVCCAVGVISELICSSVIIGKYGYSDTIAAAGAFGLMAMFLFMFETIFYVIKCRQTGLYGSVTTSSTTTTTTTTTNAQPQEFPPQEYPQENIPTEY